MSFCQHSFPLGELAETVLTKGHFLTVGMFALITPPKLQLLSDRDTATEKSTFLRAFTASEKHLETYLPFQEQDASLTQSLLP